MGLGLSPHMGLGLSAKPALEAGFFFCCAVAPERALGMGWTWTSLDMAGAA